MHVKIVSHLWIFQAVFCIILGEDFNYPGYKTTNNLKNVDDLTTKSAESIKHSNNLRTKTAKTVVVIKTVEINFNTTVNSSVDDIWNTTILSNSGYMSENVTKKSLLDTLNTQPVTHSTETQIETTTQLKNVGPQSFIKKTGLATDKTKFQPQYSQSSKRPQQYSDARRKYFGVPNQYRSGNVRHPRPLKNYPGVLPPQMNPPTDTEIVKILQKYRGMLKKLRSNTLFNQNNMKVTPSYTPVLYPQFRGLKNSHTKKRKRNRNSGVLKQNVPRTTPGYQRIEFPYFRQGGNETTTVTTDGQTTVNETSTTSNGTTRRGPPVRFTPGRPTASKVRRTTALRVSFEEHCDYNAYYCLKAFDTSYVCGKTGYYSTHCTFDSYCQLDYVNCMERYEVWHVHYMGICMNINYYDTYINYEYKNDAFLDKYYIFDEK